jgi:hypothetical protein
MNQREEENDDLDRNFNRIRARNINCTGGNMDNWRLGCNLERKINNQMRRKLKIILLFMVYCSAVPVIVIWILAHQCWKGAEAFVDDREGSLEVLKKVRKILQGD